MGMWLKLVFSGSFPTDSSEALERGATLQLKPDILSHGNDRDGTESPLALFHSFPAPWLGERQVLSSDTGHSKLSTAHISG